MADKGYRENEKDLGINDPENSKENIESDKKFDIHPEAEENLLKNQLRRRRGSQPNNNRNLAQLEGEGSWNREAPDRVENLPGTRRMSNNQHDAPQNPVYSVAPKRMGRGSKCCGKIFTFLLCFVASGFIHWIWAQAYVKPGSIPVVQCHETEAEIFKKLKEIQSTTAFLKRHSLLLNEILSSTNFLKFLDPQAARQDRLFLQIVEVYKKEEFSIPAEFYDKHKDIKHLLDQVWGDLRLNATKTICERHLTDISEVTKLLGRICTDFINEQMQGNKPERFVSSFTFRVEDVVVMGDDFAFSEKYIHSVVSYFTASNLYVLRKERHTTAIKIENCVHKIFEVAKKMATKRPMKRIIIDHVIPLMRKMVKLLRTTENASDPVKVELEAGCMMNIGLCYSMCDHDQLSVDEYESAIKLMKKEFMEKAENYQVYGDSLNNAGAAHGRMGEYSKALELHKKSLEAYGKVKNWANEADKNRVMSTAGYNLRITEQRLGQ